jgi:hypothetical protein
MAHLCVCLIAVALFSSARDYSPDGALVAQLEIGSRSERSQLPLNPPKLQRVLPRVQLNLDALVRDCAGQSSESNRRARQILSSCLRSGARIEWAIAGQTNLRNVRFSISTLMIAYNKSLRPEKGAERGNGERREMKSCE